MAYFAASLLIAAATISSALGHTTVKVNGGTHSVANVITKDFAVIGGGSSGTYAAVRLTDLGHTVAVIEKQDRMGGHTSTWIDPATGRTIETGVQVFHNNSLVASYFERFNLSLAAASFGFPGVTNAYADLTTGQMVNYTAPTTAAITSAMQTYVGQISKYPYLATGLNVTYPVPADLLLPFGQFVEKYGLGGAVSTMANIGQGLGNYLNQLTLYCIAGYNMGLLTQSLVTTANRDNSALYTAAQEFLGADNVYLSANILAVDRSGTYNKVLISTPSGLILVQAKKLVVTIPPLLSNMLGWDLTLEEFELFIQFTSTAYYTSLINSTSIPATMAIHNVAADTPYNLPSLPGIYSVSQTGVKGVVAVTYGSQHAMSESAVQASMLSSVEKFITTQNANGAKMNVSSAPPAFLDFENHAPFRLDVSAEAVANGFYKNLYDLQGKTKTYWTGAAFYTHDSSLLWQFTESLLPVFTS